jgi:VCBS repeat-containing protein
VSAHAHDLLGGTVSATAAQGVLTGDSDANPGDVLSVSAVLGSGTNVGNAVNGAFGVLTLNSDGSYSYNNTNPSAVTAAGGVTEDLFNYTVSNGHGGTADATLAVLITSPNDIYKTGTSGMTLKGGSGNYVLDGSAGHMNLTAGNQGQQWLVGGPGDTLSGGKSTDTFMFAPGFGKETINNFNATHDVIDLPQSLFADFAAVQADMHVSGSSTIIMVDANDVITLNHVSITSLHASNFHFLV